MERTEKGKFSKQFEINRELLMSYCVEGLSQNRIAQLLGCSQALISKLFKKFVILTRRNFKPHDAVVLTDAQNDILFGILLGDGHLTARKSGNSQLSYLSHLEAHSKYVGSFF